MKKIKSYRVIGKDYDCVYVSALASKNIETVKRETEERTGKKIDRLEYVSIYPAWENLNWFSFLFVYAHIILSDRPELSVLLQMSILI